ncbi:IclR family transcriptional regulator [Cupriavidus basilensis]|uniref:IclR family transcriptional regulator n=1 Tax=Cupriavidus basilensis TaxID=68895 RepID=UPI0009E40F3E|nr:IclR family transcriptional regulator C-terminal domain-containing protein [Cupriavidus basilensis]
MEAGKDVGAVIQAASILRVLSDTRQPLGVTAIARIAALNPSTALNILRTLVKERLVAFEPATKTYGLDLGLLELARVMLGKTEVELLRPGLQRIANQFEATVSVWRVVDSQRAPPRDSRGDSPRFLLLDRLKPELGVHIEFRSAMRIPLYAGAIGRAAAAAGQVSPDRLREAFAGIRWNTPMPFERYLAEIDEARQRGYAVDAGVLIKSVVSVAAAIADAHGRPALAVSTHTFSGQLADDALHELGRCIGAACAQAQAALFGQAGARTG